MISTPTKLFRNGAASREGKTIPITKHLFRAAMIAGTALSLLTAAGPASADLVYDWTEPSSLALVGGGLLRLWFVRRRKVA